MFPLSFLFINKTLRLKNLKPRTPMNVKIPVFVVSVEAIIYLLLYVTLYLLLYITYIFVIICYL